MVSAELVVQVSPVGRFPVGVAAGVVATLAMDLAASRLSEGATPPRIAAGVLTERRSDGAPERLASVVHYLAGALTGPLYVWLLYAGESLVGGPSVAATLLAAAALFVLMVGFFVVVVLPRARGIPGPRAEDVARDWALSAAAYVAVLVPLVALGSELV